MKKTLVVLINGTPRSGKDTLCKNVSNYITKYDINTYTISTVDFVKEVYEYITGEERDILKGTDEEEKYRKFLSDSKDLYSWYDNIPNKKVKDFVDKKSKDSMYDNLFFVHVREPQDIEMLKNMFNICTTLFVERVNDNAYNNHADTNIYDYEYKYIIENNNTLEDFNIGCMTLADVLKKEYF